MRLCYNTCESTPITVTRSTRGRQGAVGVVRCQGYPRMVAVQQSFKMVLRGGPGFKPQHRCWDASTPPAAAAASPPRSTTATAATAVDRTVPVRRDCQDVLLVLGYAIVAKQPI